jgi:hypothetical protein
MHNKNNTSNAHSSLKRKEKYLYNVIEMLAIHPLQPTINTPREGSS